ncbi:MAG: hypothetical protein DRN96_02315 [Thermoproteota archaeon]|nr:MAG: hypothetical protein DRN96_02315 [Candidatus Korarchaeota archaeon]
MSVVVPGEELGVAEAYMGGEGTYQRDGVICAKYVGVLEVSGRKVRIHKVKEHGIPAVGQLVLAEITGKNGIVVLTKVWGLWKSEKRIRVLKNPFTAALLQQESTGELNVSDIIIARVSSIVGKQILLDMPPGMKEIGIVWSMCGYCGTLRKRYGYSLVCNSCGRVDTAVRVSYYYGLQLKGGESEAEAIT